MPGQLMPVILSSATDSNTKGFMLGAILTEPGLKSIDTVWPFLTSMGLSKVPAQPFLSMISRKMGSLPPILTSMFMLPIISQVIG